MQERTQNPKVKPNIVKLAIKKINLTPGSKQQQDLKSDRVHKTNLSQRMATQLSPVNQIKAEIKKIHNDIIFNNQFSQNSSPRISNSPRIYDSPRIDNSSRIDIENSVNEKYPTNTEIMNHSLNQNKHHQTQLLSEQTSQKRNDQPDDQAWTQIRTLDQYYQDLYQKDSNMKASDASGKQINQGIQNIPQHFNQNISNQLFILNQENQKASHLRHQSPKLILEKNLKKINHEITKQSGNSQKSEPKIKKEAKDLESDRKKKVLSESTLIPKLKNFLKDQVDQRKDSTNSARKSQQGNNVKKQESLYNTPRIIDYQIDSQGQSYQTPLKTIDKAQSGKRHVRLAYEQNSKTHIMAIKQRNQTSHSIESMDNSELDQIQSERAKRSVGKKSQTSRNQVFKLSSNKTSIQDPINLTANQRMDKLEQLWEIKSVKPRLSTNDNNNISVPNSARQTKPDTKNTNNQTKDQNQLSARSKNTQSKKRAEAKVEISQNIGEKKKRITHRSEHFNSKTVEDNSNKTKQIKSKMDSSKPDRKKSLEKTFVEELKKYQSTKQRSIGFESERVSIADQDILIEDNNAYDQLINSKEQRRLKDQKELYDQSQLYGKKEQELKKQIDRDNNIINMLLKDQQVSKIEFDNLISRENSWDRGKKTLQSKLIQKHNDIMDSKNQQSTPKQPLIFQSLSQQTQNRSNLGESSQIDSQRETQLDVMQKVKSNTSKMFPKSSNDFQIPMSEKNLDDLEILIKKELQKTDYEVKQLEDQERRLLWQENKELKKMKKAKSKMLMEEQIKWDQKQAKRNDINKQKKKEIDKDFKLYNNEFKTQLSSPRPEHNNQRYNEFFENKNRDMSDAQIDKLCKVNTLQRELQYKIHHKKLLQDDILEVNQRLKMEDLDENQFTNQSLKGSLMK